MIINANPVFYTITSFSCHNLPIHTTTATPSNNITLNILPVATLNNSQKQQKYNQRNTLPTVSRLATSSMEITYEKPKEQKQSLYK